MKQNKQEQIRAIFPSIGCSGAGDEECYYQDAHKQGFWDKEIAKVEQLISQTRQEAVEEVFRIMSEELSVSYPDPGKGFNDRIEMDVEDLCDEIEKSLSSKEEE